MLVKPQEIYESAKAAGLNPDAPWFSHSSAEALLTSYAQIGFKPGEKFETIYKPKLAFYGIPVQPIKTSQGIRYKLARPGQKPNLKVIIQEAIGDEAVIAFGLDRLNDDYEGLIIAAGPKREIGSFSPPSLWDVTILNSGDDYLIAYATRRLGYYYDLAKSKVSEAAMDSIPYSSSARLRSIELSETNLRNAFDKKLKVPDIAKILKH